MMGPSETSDGHPSKLEAESGQRVIPVQKRAKQTVESILETAAVLVDEVGVVAFTTNLLAERANLRIRTIYRYFPNKLGILKALLLHLNDESAAQFKMFANLSDPETDWRELVDDWIQDMVEWTRERPGARFVMGWSHGIPELVAIQEEIDDEWAYNMARAMRKRGIELPDKQLYAVCRNFSETLDSLSALALARAHGCSAEMIEEARRMLVRYLEPYLD